MYARNGPRNSVESDRLLLQLREDQACGALFQPACMDGSGHTNEFYLEDKNFLCPRRKRFLCGRKVNERARMTIEVPTPLRERLIFGRIVLAEVVFRPILQPCHRILLSKCQQTRLTCCRNDPGGLHGECRTQGGDKLFCRDALGFALIADDAIEQHSRQAGSQAGGDGGSSRVAPPCLRWPAVFISGAGRPCPGPRSAGRYRAPSPAPSRRGR